METSLDRASAEMTAAPQDDAARLRFYGRLAESELFVLLEAEPSGDALSPQVLAVEDGRFVLAFDTEERLAQTGGRGAPYAALSGRALAAMLAGQGLGLGLNLSGSGAAALLPAEAMNWLAEIVARRPETTAERPVAVRAPDRLPETFLAALDGKLAAAAGLARAALLASVSYSGGRDGHLLAFLDTAAGAEAALTETAGEALVFSGLEAGTVDVAFLESGDPVARRLGRVALRFDLPAPEAPPAPIAPGSDRDKPPRLR